ncbi:E3 ubiquitin-protein ligase RNF168-like [Cydia strobilella]|uniref:E3 ubiquitin-protein ligase RNF168-like n=1 Tax=Cydia strobilella TaxID=1100964 RepID=UPI00300676D0
MIRDTGVNRNGNRILKRSAIPTVKLRLLAVLGGCVRIAPPAPAGARCGVCLEEPLTRVLIPCGHVLCDECLVGIRASEPQMRDSCPYCRTHIGNLH